MNSFDRFAEYLYGLSQENFRNRELEEQVCNCLIDYTSAIIGGTKLCRDKIYNILENSFDGGDYNIVGFKTNTSLESAMLSNGILSHIAELDDGVIEGIIHPGAPIFTSIFSVYQKVQIDWHLFIKAIVIGYEAACRIAEAIQPSHKLLGYHASATCGTLGVAMALATLSRFDKDKMRQALAIALASSHGTLKVLEDQSELKPYNIATAVINGFVSFQMAKAGFKGADNPFEGEAGFFSQMAQNIDYDKLIGDKNNLCIYKAYFKPYASCRYTHPSIEAAIKIRNLYKLNPNEIDDIKISTYSIAIRHHDHTEVPNVSSAKMCIPFAAAVGLIIGSGGIEAFCDETVHNAIIKNLTRKVRVLEEKDYSTLFPDKSIATMTVKTNDGKIYSSTVDLPKGEHDNPMTHEDLLYKLKKSCEYADFSFDGIIDIINNLHINKIEDYFGNLNKYYFGK